ncbi:MAG: SDR family NAD(P)-dependent oxidoreductase, partial [Saprospiraceae bacterium]
MPITNLTVLITGSTGGLGAALAEKLYERGANLALLDLDQATVTAQAAALGERAHGWVADVRSEDALRTAINAAADHFGRLDVVIANAGIGVSSSLANGTVEEFERIIDINLSGVWRTFHAALPHVVRSRGYLLAISSMAAFIHAPLMGAYNASKAGVLA